jgi:hypothetical protein
MDTHRTAANAALPSKARDLAEALAGVIVPNHGDNQVLTPAGLIYTGCTGKVRLQRAGRPVVDLGTVRDDVATIVEAYRVVTKEAAA